MIRYSITDRRGLGGIEPLLASIEHQMAARTIDWIQIREKDLEGGELVKLSRRVVELAAPRGVKVLVNSRLDVALAAGAHGVHLPSGSMAPSEFKQLAPALLVGVSCHDAFELHRAEAEGADFAVLGPVFAPLSKKDDRAPLGLVRFAELVGEVKIPVLALGGITWDRLPACAQAGAAGIAGISIFQGLQTR